MFVYFFFLPFQWKWLNLFLWLESNKSNQLVAQCTEQLALHVIRRSLECVCVIVGGPVDEIGEEVKLRRFIKTSFYLHSSTSPYNSAWDLPVGKQTPLLGKGEGDPDPAFLVAMKSTPYIHPGHDICMIFIWTQGGKKYHISQRGIWPFLALSGRLAQG